MAERKCPRCGASIPDSDFITLCPSCGQGLEASSEPRAQASPSPEAGEAEPPARDVVCPACGAPNSASSETCWQCRHSLSATPPEPSKGERETLDLGRVFADALATRRPQEDLDEALLRAAKAASADHWSDVLTLALHMLSGAAASGEEREAAAARLAGQQIAVEITSSEEASGAETGRALKSTRMFSSLDDLPPEVRQALERQIGSLEGRVSSHAKVSRRVVVRGEARDRPAGPGVRSVSRSITVRSRQGPPRARGCISLETLAALVLGLLGLRR